MTGQKNRAVEREHQPEPGDRLFVRCEGGPCTSRLVDWPAPLEIEDSGGVYVLDDSGVVDEWFYVWIEQRLA